jgi:hypothetical protein
MTKYILYGKSLLHIPDEKTRNKFLLLGALKIDGAPQPGQEALRFRLTDEDRVQPVITCLPRVTSAIAEWNGGETTGVLYLKLAPPRNDAETGADMDNGGPERTVRVHDLLREITKDKGIRQSPPCHPEPVPEWQPAPRRGGMEPGM